MGGQYLLCICDEEWCFCSNMVFVNDEAVYEGPFPPEIACADCKAGKHVLEPG